MNRRAWRATVLGVAKGRTRQNTQVQVQVLNGGDSTAWEQFSLSQQGWGVLQAGKA